MASHQRQRPQLNVDMRLQPPTEEEEDPDIRMNVISKKRRLRYALMEESSDDEDDHGFETQQAAGQEPFEGNYQHTQLSSAPLQKETQEEQFVLPPFEHDSSSSENDSDEDEEEEQHKPARLRESAMTMQPAVHDYANENDLFDAAFVAPENRFPLQPAGEKENAKHDSISSMNQPFPSHHTNKPQVFDLCASDEEEQDVRFTAQQRATFLGVRREDKSPRFNANSRHAFSPNAAVAAARRPCVKPPTSTTNEHDDDIVDCWSSEDERGNTKPRARRVTNHPNGFASRTLNPRSSSTFHAASNDDNGDGFDRMPAPSRQKNVLNQFKADRSDRNKRRLRDATTGMHSAASIPFPRNDLHGGSGVGVGKYTFTAGQSFQQSFQQPVAPVATGARKRKQKAAPKKGGKKRGSGGKRSYYRKKGGGKKNNRSTTSRGGGGGGRGRSRSKRGAGSNEEYSRKDPLLKNVGGASIIF